MLTSQMTAVTAVVVNLDEHGLDDDAAVAAARAVVTEAATSLVVACAGSLAEAPDSLLAATFSRPTDALGFALGLRRDVGEASGAVPPSIALSTGEQGASVLTHSPERSAARIASLAQPGQVLVSRSTGDLLRARLPEGSRLRDLGPWRPRDLGRPEHVFEVLGSEEAEDPVLLRGLDVVPHNLPVQPTSFVGRESQMAEVARLLASGRVLTLSGPGGCGKSRLALQVAAHDVEAHPDGVWVADLAPIADPTFVPSAVADALGVGAVPFKTLEQAVIDHLGPLDALLVLDNCEHLVDAARQIVENLLRGCPRLVVITTSREPLGCDGEVTWRVPSLSFPREDDREEAESVRLFVDRASAVRPTFRLDESNATVVSEICRRLDGIPLAIELAAARARALTPAQIAGQLADRFALLTGGRKTSLPRHRTLEASVDWSYALLANSERVLLRRLGVFTGGFDLAAAEGVCPGEGLEAWTILDALTGLVDRSLVQLDDSGHGRYRVFETIRQYAVRKLIEAGEIADLRDRHLLYYQGVAVAAEPELVGPGMLKVLAKLETEIDNLRAAYDWAMQSGRSVDAWQLASALWLFWQRHRADEGARRLAAALEPPGGDPLERAKALMALADLVYWGGDVARGRQLADEIMALATSVGDPRMLGRGTNGIAFAGMYLGDPDAVANFGRALELHRAVGDDYFVIDSLSGLAYAGWLTGDAALVRSSAAEAMLVSRRTANPGLVSRALFQASVAAWMEGELDEMATALDQQIPLTDQLRDEVYGPVANGFRAWLLAIRGEPMRGLELAESVSARSTAVNSVLGIGIGLWARAVIEHDLALDSAVGTLMEAQATNAVVGFPHLAAECSARLAATAAVCGDEAGAREHVAALEQLAASPHGHACRPWTHLATAEVALVKQDTTLATSAIHEALSIWTAAGNRLGVVTALELLVHLDARTGRHVEAARLLGATAAERARLRWPLPRIAQAKREADRTSLDVALGTAGLAAALAEGSAMDLKEATAYARRGRGARRKAASGWSSLTATEVDVARLVAEGLKNAEIAARLFVSPVTVKTHVAHAFTKLGVRNRAELAAFAHREDSPDRA
ncbi:MAG TPA: LuxR C-terminal-related transcriptional regulator [Mycobacteriales bacterium]|nr:LuxR C-terminal-related transcriptional regulator [Mycobacteriales bacterium]